jgi:enediyne biosynthesis protein E7
VRGVTAAAPALASRPSGHPIIGHLQAYRKDRLGLLDACLHAPEDVVELRIGRPTYVLKRPEDIKHVFARRRDAYAKSQRNVGRRAKRIFGDGLITSAEAPHRAMRRRVQPVFYEPSIARLADVIVRNVDAMVDRWGGTGEIDLAEEMATLSLRAMVEATFGPASAAELAALEQGLAARRHAMSRGFNSLITLPGFLPLAISPRRRRAISVVDRHLGSVIRQHGERSGAGDGLLAMLMATHRGANEASDPRRVRGEALSIVLAAYDNVARALTWTLSAVARHRSVEAGLREEIQEVLGHSVPTGACRGLRYTDMVIAESMRLWPPTPLVFRIALADDILPTGMPIPAGSKLLISPYIVQRDPRNFPDPERFDPRRFDREQRRGRPQFAYFPFGGGPRVCIGRTLATLQCRLVLARLAQRVRLELAGDAPGYVCGCLPPGFGPRMRVH